MLERFVGKLFLVLAAAWLALFTESVCFAQAEPHAQNTEQAKCFFYRAKMDGVPVYDEPATTGKVLAKLSLGDKVCYVGEKGDFAILDWTRQPELGEKQDRKVESPKVAYARLVDLWEPRDRGGVVEYGVRGVFARALQYYHYLRSGGVPDEGFFPFREFEESRSAQQCEQEEE